MQIWCEEEEDDTDNDNDEDNEEEEEDNNEQMANCSNISSFLGVATCCADLMGQVKDGWETFII